MGRDGRIKTTSTNWERESGGRTAGTAAATLTTRCDEASIAVESIA
jgi:hypothetical protein